MKLPVTFTIATNTEGYLSKEYSIVDGIEQKKANCSMSTGYIRTVTHDFSELDTVLENCKSNEALIMGVTGFKKKAICAKNYPIEGAIARIKENFELVAGKPTFMVFDLDLIKGMKFRPKNYKYGPFKFLKILYECCPGLRQAPMWIRESVSSAVCKKGEKWLPKGTHIYVYVTDGSKIVAFAEALKKHLWIMGHGWYDVGERGQKIERVPYDMAVLKEDCVSRLIFEGKPVVDDHYDIVELKARPLHMDGQPFNLEISSPDEQKYKKAQESELAKRMPEMLAQQKKWMDKKVEEGIAKGLTQAEATNKVCDMIGIHPNGTAKNGRTNVLYNEYILVTGKRETVTVMDIMKDPLLYDLVDFYDPIEGVAYGHTTALFHYNKGACFITSRAHGTDTTYWLQRHWRDELQAHIDECNKKWVKVKLFGHARIAVDSWEKQGAYKYPTWIYYDIKELAKHDSNSLIQTSEKWVRKYDPEVNKSVPVLEPVYTDKSTAWYNSPLARKAGDVEFEPICPQFKIKETKKVIDGKEYVATHIVDYVPFQQVIEPNKPFNIWRGYSVEPVKNRALIKHIKRHMLEVICSGNQDDYDYLVKLYAFSFQFPDRLAQVAHVMRGDKRVGKGQFAQLMLRIYGTHGLHILTSRTFTSKFNFIQYGKVFICIDESFFSGRKEDADLLKGRVTETSIEYEKKGVDSTVGTNYANLTIISNDEKVVAATWDDDRYFVSDVADTYKPDRTNKECRNRAYMDQLNSDINNKDVQAAFLEWMLSIPHLANWVPQSNVPVTAGLVDQIRQNFDSLSEWFSICLDKGDFKGFTDRMAGNCIVWPTKVRTQDLWDSYEQYLNSNQSGNSTHKHIKNFTDFSRKFAKFGFDKAERIDGDIVRGYDLGTIDQAYETFYNHHRCFNQQDFEDFYAEKVGLVDDIDAEFESLYEEHSKAWLRKQCRILKINLNVLIRKENKPKFKNMRKALREWSRYLK